MKEITKETTQLVETIIDALHEKKGIEVTSINLSKLRDPVCDYFIVCHADSKPQTHALADSVVVKVKEKFKENAWHKEGLENAQWVLLDYSNVVVHIFQTEWRTFYNLEGLWADAEIIQHQDKNDN